MSAAVRALVPAAPAPDSISVLGGRQQLTAEVLAKALAAYFPADGFTLKDNDITIAAPPAGAASAYFSGAMDAIIEDHKFALVVARAARTAGITLVAADGTEVLARAIHDADGLVRALEEFWPQP